MKIIHFVANEESKEEEIKEMLTCMLICLIEEVIKMDKQ